ncbi:hypothetical protein [Haloferula sp. BvORR071]|uniref:hypothetical protein n=1 Tax=Haloferula sp. BvORR071 TaxID=1396141 RepID=UPI00055295EA|nr:hypothetical protein [Haloferula sp. BvORR071]
MNRLRHLPPLFWIGLLPVVALLWLWADSTSYETEWCHCREWNRARTLTAYHSELVYQRREVIERVPGAGERFFPYYPLAKTWPAGRLQHHPVARPAEKAPWFPAVRSYVVQDRHRSQDFEYVTEVAELPFWMILLGYAPIWLGISWWQARRLRKRIAAMGPHAGDLGERHREPRMGTDLHG